MLHTVSGLNFASILNIVKYKFSALETWDLGWVGEGMGKRCLSTFQFVLYGICLS